MGVSRLFGAFLRPTLRVGATAGYPLIGLRSRREPVSVLPAEITMRLPPFPVNRLLTGFQPPSALGMSCPGPSCQSIRGCHITDGAVQTLAVVVGNVFARTKRRASSSETGVQGRMHSRLSEP